MNSIDKIADKNILFLQGPVGFFFKKLDNLFHKNGANTYRIGFNAGDSFFSNTYNYTPYRETPESWQDFILKFLKEKKIDKLFLFGDCRFYQRIAIQVALSLEIEVYVFEEGYVRPHYITLEKYGVNNYSHISRNPEFYKNLELKTIEPPKNSTPNPLSNWAIVIAYYCIANLFHFRYPNYKHHRNFSAVKEFFYGSRSLVRKVIYSFTDKKYAPLIEGELHKKYFFVPLQTHNDFQILQHSHYGSIEKFITQVLESFAKRVQDETKLIFKHHPVDRGRMNYSRFIYEQAEELGIEKRVIVFHDVHLPSCLKNAIGTVTINSTVGLSSIHHETPTITLGNAIYDIKGLTCKGMTLDDFWHSYKQPDMVLYEKYRNYIISKTQLNGSFYGVVPTFTYDA